MGFDNSRRSFKPWKDYTRPVIQQGRPQLDSDWNEGQDAVARRIQAGTMDTLGRAVVPATTPYAFKINASQDASGQHITIGAGRMYVDGLLAENHGPVDAAQWDPALAELSGAPPEAAEVGLDFTQQPYFLDADTYLASLVAAGSTGPFLAYLDVWQRAVTYLEDPTLIETAVGVDTTGRWQTAWQVRLLDVSGVGGGVTCATPDASIPPWESLIQPTASRLTTGVVQTTPSGPCCLSPSTGYTGLENQLYRVEIHQGGGANATGDASPPAATFKWSRDNASVATGVTVIAPATSNAGTATSALTVQSTGKDEVLSFKPGDWIEITDDYLELNGQVGELHQIDTNGVDQATNSITLQSPVSSAFPTDGNNQTDPQRHTRICRWDQKGKTYLSDGATLWADLDAPGSTGAIPVPPKGTTLILEDGVTVKFDLDPAGGSFMPGDYWAFAARAANGWVEPLEQAPPLGIHHHYARLAVLTLPSATTDCRTLWPPSTGDGCACGCTVTVRPEDLTPEHSLQNLLDQYQNLQTATVICLMPGTYVLSSPLRFTSAHSGITLRACQEGTVLLQAEPRSEGQFADGLVVLDTAHNVTLRGLEFVLPALPFRPTRGQFAGLPVTSLDPDVQTVVRNLQVSIGVRPVSCTALTIEKCRFQLGGPRDRAADNAIPFRVGVFAAGECSDWRLEGNEFLGAIPFAAGFLLAPSVSFNSPTRLRDIRPAIAAEASTVAVPTAPEAATSPGSQTAPGITEVEGGIGMLQGLVGRGTSLPDLAAGGGQVVPATLNDAVVRANSFSRLTVAALILGASEAVEFAGNDVDACVAGVWLLSPWQARYVPGNLLYSAILVGLSVALGYPLPRGVTIQPARVSPAPSDVRIYAGRSTYRDTAGHIWSPDVDAPDLTIGGSSLNQPANPQPIPNSADQTLYQSERYGNWSYVFDNLPEGYYQVTLKFAEIFWNAANIRVFNVVINDMEVVTDFDIFAVAGGENAAVDKVFTDIAAVDNAITVQFVGTAIGTDGNAKVSAVEISPQWSADRVASLSSVANELQNFLAQLVMLGEQAFAGLTIAPSQVRITGNEMRGLSSLAVLLFGGDDIQSGRRGSLLMTDNRLQNKAQPSVRSDPTEGAPAPRARASDFSVTVALSSITRCLVSANMILNEDTSPDRFSFTLDDGALPAAGVAVMSNLFYGHIWISPQRFPVNPPPYPMNDWTFVNTVTL